MDKPRLLFLTGKPAEEHQNLVGPFSQKFEVTLLTNVTAGDALQTIEEQGPILLAVIHHSLGGAAISSVGQTIGEMTGLSIFEIRQNEHQQGFVPEEYCSALINEDEGRIISTIVRKMPTATT